MAWQQQCRPVPHPDWPSGKAYSYCHAHGYKSTIPTAPVRMPRYPNAASFPTGKKHRTATFFLTGHLASPLHCVSVRRSSTSAQSRRSDPPSHAVSPSTPRAVVAIHLLPSVCAAAIVAAYHQAVAAALPAITCTLSARREHSQPRTGPL
jgi:hypothetical protein